MSGQQFEGFGQRAGGVGRRPALVIIDMNNGFTDPASPLVCELDDTIEAIRKLLDAARRAEVPVVYTTVSYGEGDKVVAKAFIDKVPVLLTLAAGSRWVEIDERIAPRPNEPVLNKLFASAFFGTPFASLLASHGCDSVIVTGASTSGCVRATAVDVAAVRLPAGGAAGGGRRSQPRGPRGGPLRHRPEVRRRRVARRVPGGAGRAGCRTRSLRRSCWRTSTSRTSGPATSSPSAATS